MGISSGAIDQQPELQPLLLFLWQSKPLKSAHSPNKNWKFITSGTPCACVSAWPQCVPWVFQRWRVRHGARWTWRWGKVPTWSLWNEWIITVCAGGDQQVCLLYSGTTVCDMISHPYQKRLCLQENKNFSAQCCPLPWLSFLTMLYYYKLGKARVMGIVLKAQ